MKTSRWTRATGLAAAMFLGTGLSPLSAQGLLNGLGGGGAGGAAGGQAASGAAGGVGGVGGPRAGLGNRLDVNSSVRGVNPAQAVRGATNAGAGLGGGARAQAGLGVGANAGGAGVRARGSAQGDGAARGRTGLFSNSNVDTGVAADAGVDADLSADTSMDRRGLSGREHAGYQAEMTLNHRLAEIDRMRDHALSTGNTVQLAKADELEAQARATFQHRLDVIRTAPDTDTHPQEQPRDIRSRIRAGLDGQANAGSPVGGHSAGVDISGDAAEATDIAVQRPELFGRMRQRARADIGAAARSEQRGLLHFTPRGGAAEATGEVAAQADGRFAAEPNPRGRINTASDSLVEAEARVEEAAPSRVRPVASSRFAADFQGQGSMEVGEAARSGGAFRGEVQGEPLDTRGGMRRARQEIEQVDYSASSGVEAGGRASGRVSGAMYSEADAAFGNVPRATQRTRAEASGAIRAGQDAGQNAGQGGWEGIEDADVRSDVRQETRARFPADRNASGSVYGAGEATGRLDGRKLYDEPVSPPADPRFGGRAATDLNANGTLRGSDEVYSASSNMKGRSGATMSGSSIRSRSQFDASAGAARQPVNPDDYTGRP